MPERFVAPVGADPAFAAIARVSDLNAPQPTFAPEFAAFVSAVAGDFKRVSPRVTGMTVTLESPSATTFGKSIALYVANALGALTIRPISGTINGAASLAIAAGTTRIVRLWSDGVSGWTTEYPGAVENAALASMPARTVKANATNATAPPQDVPLGTNEVLARAGGDIVGVGITTQAVLGRQGANIVDIASVGSTWLGRDGGADLGFYPPVGGGRASLSVPISTTASASSFGGPFFSIPANTLAVGQVWRATAWYRFSRGATATALNINCRLRVTADLVEAFVVSNTAVGEYQGRVEVCFTVASVGVAGTAYGSAWLDHMLGRTTGLPGTQAAHNGGANVETATVAIDTTVANTFQLRMSMTAAVASTTLTMTHGVIERVF